MELFKGITPYMFRRMGILQDSVCFVCAMIVTELVFAPSISAAQLCTQKVQVEAGKGTQKVAMIKRIPAQCSNWDRAWVWLTSKDCGTKYVTQYESFPSQYPTYRLEYICCKNDPECDRTQTGALQSEDERFLAITFGSAVAVLAVLGLIFLISFCHKRRQSMIIWKRNQELYEATNGVDAVGCEADGARMNEYVDDRLYNFKLMGESDYEEIRDTPPDYKTATEKKCIIYKTNEDNIAQEETKFHINDTQPFLTPTAPLISLREGDPNEPQEEAFTPVENRSIEDIPISVLNSETCDMKPNETDVKLDVLHLAEFNPQKNNEPPKTGDDSGSFCKLDTGENDIKPCLDDDTLVKTGEEKAVTEGLNPSVASDSRNEYTDFGELCRKDSDDGILYTNSDSSHSYEHLDPSTREYPSQHQTYEALIISETCPNEFSSTS